MSDLPEQGPVSVGSKAVLRHIFRRSVLGQHQTLTLDMNPLYSDEEFVSNSVFSKPIVPASLITGLMGGLIGSELPGYGSVLVYQEHNFFKPLFFEQEFFVSVEVTGIESAKGVFYLELACTDIKEQTLVRGKAVVLNRSTSVEGS